MKLFFGLALAVVLCGCSQSDSGTSGTVDNSTASGSTTTATTTGSSTTGSTPAAANLPDPQTRQPKDGDDVAVMETSMGKIVLMFFPDKAPHHVENFTTLAKKGFYDGTKFHRIIPDFMLQGGDPNTKTDNQASWGQGGPGYNVNAEFNDVHHAPGILSMARTGDPNGAGSQFFIMVADKPQLDGQYTVFGKVVAGMDVVNKLKNVPTKDKASASNPQGTDRPIDPPVIKSLKIVKWPVK